MAQSRDIQRRIRSVRSTRKITKAMELVAAAKMRRAITKVLATRAYSDLSWQTVLHLAEKVDKNQHPFFAKREPVKKTGIILVSSNRGLCGSFNVQLVNKVMQSITLHHPQKVATELITFGSRGRTEARRRRLNLVADFIKQDVTQNITDIRPMASLVIDDFLSGKYDRVFLAYTDFISSLRQVPHVKQLLPIEPYIDERLGHINHEAKEKFDKIEADNFAEFLFEPNISDVLLAFLPRLVEVQIYQAVLESEASEHSARMLAMRNASDAALEMIDFLTLAYNQARQAGITAELAEIASGSLALQE